MKEYLTQRKIIKKTLEIEDFSKVTSLAIGLKVGKTLELNCKKQKLPYGVPTRVVRGYFVANKLFLLCSNGYLYSFDGSTFVKELECENKVPTLAETKINGEEKTLVLTDSKAVVLGETNQVVSMPYGTSVCVYNGRIFVADKNTLYVGKQFDFVNFSVQFGDYNFINIDKNDGQILGIFNHEKALLIVCENAVYKLTISSDYSYELKRVCVDNLNIKTNSVCSVGNSIFFINGNNLCCYKKDNFKIVDSFINYNDFYVDGLACSGGGKYYLPIVNGVDNQRYIYVYDTINNQESLTDINDCILCGGEYFVDNFDNLLGKITLEKDTSQGGKWLSKKIDFNTNAKKSLLALSIYIECDATLIIKGDFGIKEYTLKKGRTKKALNLYSCDFTFEISFNNGDFKAENLQLEYCL